MLHTLSENIQWVILFIVAFGLGGGYAYRKLKKVKPRKTVYANVTRREMEDGARFIPSTAWSQWRNPMKELRRYLGWPSGRQWVRRRKRYNKLFPGGAKVAAAVLTASKNRTVHNA